MSESAGEQAGAVALVALGGFIGSALRSAVDAGVGSITGAAVPIPIGTLAVNVLGSFALGALSVALSDRRLRLLVATGALSSFTTYSTFAVQTVSLGALWGAANVTATYALGFLAAAAGLFTGRPALAPVFRGDRR